MADERDFWSDGDDARIGCYFPQPHNIYVDGPQWTDAQRLEAWKTYARALADVLAAIDPMTPSSVAEARERLKRMGELP